MLLFFLCLASTRPAASCQRSFLETSSAPPSSGCTAAASSRLCSGRTTAPTPSCTTAPTPSSSESGSGMRSSPSAGSNPARTLTPNQAVRDATVDCPALAQWPSQPPPAAAVHPHPGGSHFQTPGLYTITPEAAERTPGNHFFPIPGGFLDTPGRRSFPAYTAVVPQRPQRPLVRINL
jgi:hypothetical protein